MSDTSQRREESAFTYEVSANESLSDAVVRAVATVSGAAPVPDASSDTGTDEVLEPLHAAIDPDALDAVFQHAPTRTTQPGAQVAFNYHGHEVTVTGAGRIFVEPREKIATEAAD